MATTINDKLGYIATTDELQSSIHNGIAYGFSGDGTINASSSLSFLGRTGNKDVHFHFFGGNFSKGDIRLSLYEAPTVTNDGTEITSATNLNRNFDDDNSLTIYQAPTVTDNGLKISGAYSPIAGGGAHTNPADTEIAGGRVLKRNTDYLIVIQNVDTASVDYGMNFVWTEHTVIAG